MITNRRTAMLTPANLRTPAARAATERLANRFLAANDNKQLEQRIRYRGTRPAWNWLARQDRRQAAALWLVAREFLPEAANDNQEPGLADLDRRQDGKLRGANVPAFDADAYLALPAVLPRFGDAEPEPVALCGWHTDSFSIRRQRQPDDYPLYPFGRHVRCVPGVAWCYGALVDAVGQPRPGVSRGDPRRVDPPERLDVPDRVYAVIENMLAGATLAGLGEALGYNGGYADRAGRRAMREAGEWAAGACAKSWPQKPIKV
jgi:hypothetical protein